jgi:hypothetical protein
LAFKGGAHAGVVASRHGPSLFVFVSSEVVLMQEVRVLLNTINVR